MSVSLSNEINEAVVRAQLDRILASAMFQRAPKLSGFLAYIVNESLAGRQEQITGRSIGVDVFERGYAFDPQNDPIVRVEAGRLRSKLAEYYAEEGCQDSIRIVVPKGTYKPNFEEAETTPRAFSGTLSPGILLRWPLAVFAALAVVIFTWHLVMPDMAPNSDQQKHDYENEAHQLFLDARRVARPPHIPARVLAGIELARDAQQSYPDYAGGYAAESFFRWVNVAFGHTKHAQRETKLALDLAARAIEVDVSFSWAHQAMSRALHLERDEAGALQAARRAVDLAPENPEVVGNLGFLLALFGRPEDGMPHLSNAIELAGSDARNPFRNYLSLAYFLAGDLEKSLLVAEEGVELGGPMNVQMQAIMAAAANKVGQEGKAFALARKFQSEENGPFTSTFLSTLIVNGEDRERVFSSIKEVGIALEN